MRRAGSFFTAVLCAASLYANKVVVPHRLVSPSAPIVRTAPVARISGEHVQFLNGDRLQGKLIGFNPKQGLVWRREGIKPDLNIDPAMLRSAQLVTKPAAVPGRDRARLANGDELPGKIVELNEGQLTFETSYAGNLQIKRPQLSALLPGEASGKAIYEGPTDANGWVNQVNGKIKNQPSASYWHFKDGAFHSQGSSVVIGRHLPNLPDRVNFEFQASWASSLSLYINLFTDRFTGYSSGNSYCMRLTQSSARMYRYQNNGQGSSSRSIGSTKSFSIPEVHSNRTAHISIRVDRRQKKIALIINGRFINQWSDTLDFAGRGNGLMFTTRTSAAMTLSRLRVSKWNGSLPGLVKSGGAAGSNDHIQLTNSDSLSGKLLTIKAGKASLNSAFGQDMKIPLARISVIQLANPAPPATATNTVRLTLANHARVTARLIEWSEGKVKIHHPAIGDLTLDSAAIRLIDFVNQRQTSAPTTSRAQPELIELQEAVRIHEDVEAELIQKIER